MLGIFKKNKHAKTQFTMHPVQLEPTQPAELLKHVVDAQLESEVAPVHVGQLTP